MMLAAESGHAIDLAPTRTASPTSSRRASSSSVTLRSTSSGRRTARSFVPLLATFFFLILTSNLLGLIPGGKSIGGTIGGTVALALDQLDRVRVGRFREERVLGLLQEPDSLGRARDAAGRHDSCSGGFIFMLEFVSTFIVRPLTLAVRLFANMYAGHIILGVFAAFVALFWPIFEPSIELVHRRGSVGAVSLVFLILMYAFEVFVAFIQAYVFTILTAVYIQSSVHASEH